MTIEKRPNGKYRVKVWDARQHKQVNVGTFTSHAAAKSAERQAEVELETEGFLSKPADTGFGELCDSFLTTSSQVRETTLKWYTTALRPARDFFGDSHSVRRLSREECLRYVTHLVDSSKAAKTVNGYIKALGAVLEYGIEAGYLDKHPARKLRNLPENKRKDTAIRVVTREEHRRLVDHAPPSHKVMFSIWPFVGLRLAEMQGLTWADIDFEKKTLRVRRQMRLDGSLDPKLKTKKSARTILLTRQVVSELREWKLACPHSEDGLVFPTQRGLPQRCKSQFYKVWHRTCEAAGLHGLDPHDMRHTFATWSLTAGETPMWVADQMGHEKPSMTLDTYAHLLPQELNGHETSRLEQWHGEWAHALAV